MAETTTRQLNHCYTADVQTVHCSICMWAFEYIIVPVLLDTIKGVMTKVS